MVCYKFLWHENGSFGAPIVSGPIHGSSKGVGVILRFLALPAMNVDLLELTLALQEFHDTLQKRKLKYGCFRKWWYPKMDGL